MSVNRAEFTQEQYLGWLHIKSLRECLYYFRDNQEFAKEFQSMEEKALKKYGEPTPEFHKSRNFY